MAPQMEPKSAQERLRAIREGVQKRVLKLGPKMYENGGPQGPPKIDKKVKKSVKKGSQNIALFSEGSPRGPRSPPETILEGFWRDFGVKIGAKISKN